MTLMQIKLYEKAQIVRIISTKEPLGIFAQSKTKLIKMINLS